MNILRDLGYWGENKILSPFLNEKINIHDFPALQKQKSLAVREINKALKETQL